MGYLKSFRNKNFLRFWLAQVVSQFGDRINQMALIGFIAGIHPGSTVDLAKLMAFTIIPVFTVGPIAGVYVDRWDRRKTLFVCDILRGLLVLSIPIIWMQQTSMVPIYIVVFCAFSLSRFYVPAKMSIIPDIVDEEQLHIANSLVTITGMIASFMGAVFGGLIVEYSGARGGFYWDAVTFFASAVLVASISEITPLRVRRADVIETSREALRHLRKTVFHELKEGIVYIASHAEIRFIIGVMTLLFMAAGAVYVVIIIFIQESFNSLTKDLAFIAGAMCVGLFIGSLIYGRVGAKLSRIKTIFISLTAGGAMVALFAFFVQATHNLGVAMALAVVLGMVLGPIVIAANTIVHYVCSEEMRGKVFTALEFVMHLGFLATMFLSSILSENFGVPRLYILITVGVVFLLIGIMGLLRYKGQGDSFMNTCGPAAKVTL